MKKVFAIVVASIVSTAALHAQTEKKEPPPPPPKPKVIKESVKFSPPTIIDEKVDATKPNEPPVITVSGKKADDFYKRNPTVGGISRKADIITLKMKDGTTEKYDMSKKEEDKKFTEKYGDSPIPPPPPKIVKEKKLS